MKCQIPLLKLSLTITLIGIILLLFLSMQDPPLYSINKLTFFSLNKKVKINGEIETIKNFKDYNFILITLSDSTGKINILLSEVDTNQTFFSKQQNVTVIGRLAQHQNSLQIQAERIISNP